MQRITYIVTFFILLLAGGAQAASGVEGDVLEGNWINESHDGVFTQLEIEANGQFVFREMHSKDLRRSYMCGKLTDLGDALDLEIGQQKERTRSGHVSQAVSGYSSQFLVESRSANTLVLRIDARVVVLSRS